VSAAKSYRWNIQPYRATMHPNGCPANFYLNEPNDGNFYQATLAKQAAE
jgi:hypothetical protein